MKLPRHVPLVVATRGDAVESVHYGSIAVVDASGEIVCSVGDTAFPIFTRSTLQPFLVAAAADMLSRFGSSVSLLQNKRHNPNKKAATSAAPPPPDLTSCPLH